MKDQKKNDLKKAAEAIEQLYRAISNDKISVVPDIALYVLIKAEVLA